MNTKSELQVAVSNNQLSCQVGIQKGSPFKNKTFVYSRKHLQWLLIYQGTY